MKKTILLIGVICVISGWAFAQQITNITQKIENSRVVIHYDLSGDKDATYDISVTAYKESGPLFMGSTMTDGGTIIPTVIAGRLENVKPGKDHFIWWEPVLELRDLHGWTIQLEIKVFDMVFVKGGTFQMGSNNGDSDEKPIHTVTVSDFYMSATEVTQAQWKAVMGSNPSNWKGDNLPVESVSWNDVQKFLKKLNKSTGENYRLPTEAEWEYAARGGVETNGRSSQTKYAGSNNIDEVAWYGDNSGSKTHPVGKKKPNELGLYDMSGNVWEWCNDWYDEDYYSSSPQNNPQGANSGKYRVLRGGSWLRNAGHCRVAYRFRPYPVLRYFLSGFRLVLSAR